LGSYGGDRMTDYKPGDKVECRGKSSTKDSWSSGIYKYGPFKHDRHKVSHLIESELGYHYVWGNDEIRPAPPEPEWEYGRQSIVGGATLWHSSICEDLQYRRQVGKPETIEHLTPEQVEALRND